jgi:hypothetical protein
MKWLMGRGVERIELITQSRFKRYRLKRLPLGRANLMTPLCACRRGEGERTYFS